MKGSKAMNSAGSDLTALRAGPSIAEKDHAAANKAREELKPHLIGQLCSVQ
jgi:hypothetical protein